MKLIQDNPYRIAGILANASEREVVRQKSKISKSAGIGRQVDSEFDFSFLQRVDRTDLKEVNKAFSGIEQNQDKVRHSLFWFLKTNPFDETAINYLFNGDRDKAIQIWEKVTEGKEVTSKNFSCFNNIGTLKLLGNSKEEIKAGIEAKIKLIESNSFGDFIHTIADQTYTIDNQNQAEKFVDDILKQFKGKYSSTETLKLFSICNGTTQKYLLQKCTEEPLHKIETQIESTKTKRKTNKGGAYELGLKLFENCKADLDTLKLLLGINDLKYKMIADNLAKEVMQCGIDYFQEWRDQKDPSVEGLKLLKHSKSIAVSNQVIERIDSNIEGMEEFKDKEISQAIALLQSVKDAYDANREKIQYEVMIHKYKYNKGISWTAQKQMLNNSIDWIKVVELVKKIIPQKNVEKIRMMNDTRVYTYKNLVDFLISKLSYSQINQVKYLCYWKTEYVVSKFIGWFRNH
ncbi:MAG TPA: hypothetical protein PKC30_14780 [Saprospiraceae bacterium]|nr:hypothetical protein [Saprospiraceae bacterium]